MIAFVNLLTTYLDLSLDFIKYANFGLCTLKNSFSCKLNCNFNFFFSQKSNKIFMPACQVPALHFHIVVTNAVDFYTYTTCQLKIAYFKVGK